MQIVCPQHGTHDDGYRILVSLHRRFQRLNDSPTAPRATLRRSIPQSAMQGHSTQRQNHHATRRQEAQTTLGPRTAREIVAIWDLSPHSARKVSISAWIGGLTTAPEYSLSTNQGSESKVSRRQLKGRARTPSGCVDGDVDYHGHHPFM